EPVDVVAGVGGAIGQPLEGLAGIVEVALVQPPEAEREDRAVVGEFARAAPVDERAVERLGRATAGPQHPEAEPGEDVYDEGIVAGALRVAERGPAVGERVLDAVQRPGGSEGEVDAGEQPVV